MENIRDSAYEGWMSKTSRKGKGPGKSKGRVASGESGPEEDRSWGKEASNLRQKIQKELGCAGTEGSMEAVAGGSGMQGSVDEGGVTVDERAEDESSSEDEDGEDGSEEGEAGSSEVKVLDEVRKDNRTDEKKTRDGKRMEERKEGEKDRERWRSKTCLGSAGQGWRRDAGARARSRLRSLRRRRSESGARREAGLRLGARKVCLDGMGLRIQGERLSRDREAFGGKCGQGSRTKEVQYFQQFKLIDLCVREIRKRTEEFLLLTRSLGESRRRWLCVRDIWMKGSAP